MPMRLLVSKKVGREGGEVVGTRVGVGLPARATKL